MNFQGFEIDEPFDGDQKLAYVVFAKTAKEYRSKDKEKLSNPSAKTSRVATKETAFVLPMMGSHRTPAQINTYAQKPGFRLIGYWFPEQRQWAELKTICDVLLGNVQTKKVLAEKDALEAKVKELQKRVGKE